MATKQNFLVGSKVWSPKKKYIGQKICCHCQCQQTFLTISTKFAKKVWSPKKKYIGQKICCHCQCQQTFLTISTKFAKKGLVAKKKIYRPKNLFDSETQKMRREVCQRSFISQNNSSTCNNDERKGKKIVIDRSFVISRRKTLNDQAHILSCGFHFG